MKKNILILLVACLVLLCSGCTNWVHAESEDDVSTASEASMLEKATASTDNKAQLKEENSKQEVITLTKEFKSKIKKLYEKDSDMTITCKIKNHYGECSFSWDYIVRKHSDYAYRVYVENIKCTSCNFKSITSEDVTEYMNRVLSCTTLEGIRGVDECAYDLYIFNARVREKIDASDFQRLVFDKLNDNDEIIYDSYDGECLRASHGGLGCIASKITDIYGGDITSVLSADINFDAKQSDKTQHFIKDNYTYDITLSNDELKLNSVVNDVKTDLTIKVK